MLVTVDASGVFGQSFERFMEIGVSKIEKCSVLSLVAAATFVGASLIASGAAQAGKVHWKTDPAVPSCAALAFDDTDEWFATPQGFAFKRGVCLGQSVRYKVVLAADGENFTVSGANSCKYHVGEAHEIILVGCGAKR